MQRDSFSEFTHCALPNDLKDPGECHKCIGDCTIYGITPRGPDVDVGRAAGQDYPTCEACRIKCALLKPDECSHVSGYGAGIACTGKSKLHHCLIPPKKVYGFHFIDWGGVGYCS